MFLESDDSDDEKGPNKRNGQTPQPGSEPGPSKGSDLSSSQQGPHGQMTGQENAISG